MPSHVIERIATDTERAALEEMLSNAPSGAQRVRQGAENALVLWAVSLLCAVTVWWVSAWVVRKVAGVDFGFRSPAALWVFLVAIPLAGIFAAVSSVRWVKGWKDYRALLRLDIGVGRAVEEHYEFIEAKRFQEPEHGGLLYFMRTVEDKVFAMFDHESQEFGLRGTDPLESGFTPKKQLTIVRAPRAGFVIRSTFSGLPLDAGEPIPLGSAASSLWPEPDAYCGIAWTELESTLAKQRNVKDGAGDV